MDETKKISRRMKMRQEKGKLDKNNANLLAESIEKNDSSYISEFLVSKSNFRILKYLKDKSKSKLSILLMDFLDTPLRIQTIELLKKLPKYMQDKSMFYDKIKNRVVDYSKLIYLKGKLDYIKITKLKSKNIEPENVID